MVTRPAAVPRLAVAALARLLPAGFRDRQRAEWTADLLDLTPWQRVRYLVAAAWTLPELRAVARAGRPAWWSPRGLRVGLGRPGTSGVVALAVVVAVLGAMFGAGAATRLGWEFARPMPAGAEAEELQRTVFPGVRVTGDETAAFWADSPDDRSVYQGVVYAVDPADVLRVDTPVPGVRERLSAAGWRDDPARYEVLSRADELFNGNDVRMVRDGLVLTHNTLDTSVTVTPAVPPWMGWVAVAGAAVGALIGWLLIGWAGRHAPEGTVAGQLSSLIVWPTVTIMLLWTSGGFVFQQFGGTAEEAFFRQLLYLVESPLLLLWAAVTALIASTVVAVLHRWPQIVAQ